MSEEKKLLVVDDMGISPEEAKERVASDQLAQMNKFYSSLSPRARRRMRRAVAKASGKKEGLAEMMARIPSERIA